MINKNLVVGLFVIAGLLLFTAGIVVIGDQRQVFARHIDYYTQFSDLEGLTKGSKVQVAGVDAGEILDIQIPDSPSSRFRVTLRVNCTLHGLVRMDSIATIETQGVVGETFVSIRPGSSQAAEASPLVTLRSEEPTTLSEMLKRGSGLLDSVDATLKGT